MTTNKLLPFLFIITSAFAGVGGLTGGSQNGRISEADNWDTILKTVKENPELKIVGDYAYVGRITSLFNVCTDGENLITKKPLPIYDYVGRDHKKVIIAHKTLTYPLEATQTKRVCDNKDKNCKYVEEDFIQRTVSELRVQKVKRVRGKDKNPEYVTVFTKEYYVPNCENL